MRVFSGHGMFHRARSALGGLLVALLLLTPAVDGAICATDFAAEAGQATAFACADDGQGQDPAVNGTCAHGHFHETAPMPEPMFAQMANLAGRDSGGFHNPALKLHRPSSLERPPRA